MNNEKKSDTKDEEMIERKKVEMKKMMDEMKMRLEKRKQKKIDIKLPWKIVKGLCRIADFVSRLTN